MKSKDEIYNCILKIIRKEFYKANGTQENSAKEITKWITSQFSSSGLTKEKIREELIRFYEWEVQTEIEGVPVYATNKKEVPQIVDLYLTSIELSASEQPTDGDYDIHFKPPKPKILKGKLITEKEQPEKKVPSDDISYLSKNILLQKCKELKGTDAEGWWIGDFIEKYILSSQIQSGQEKKQ